jgi:hypothetical protein
MDNKTYNKLFGETKREMFNRHNGLLIYCNKCKCGFTSKRNLKSHICREIGNNGKSETVTV